MDNIQKQKVLVQERLEKAKKRLHQHLTLAQCIRDLDKRKDTIEHEAEQFGREMVEIRTIIKHLEIYEVNQKTKKSSNQ